MQVVFRVSTPILASCAALVVACSTSGSAGTFAPANSGGSGAASTDAGSDAGNLGPASLSFTPGDTLILAPKATKELIVATSPIGNFVVRFALLGASGDAALDATDVVADDSGLSRVTLTAPSMPTTFSVRASVGSKISTLLGIAVSAQGSTTVRVLPSYTGQRSVLRWTATARAGVKCADLVGNPPPDGDLTATAAAGEALDLTRVPIGVELAITLRAGHYISGCVSEGALSEGDGNQVLVYASDRPLNLATTHLDVSFGPSAPEPALYKLMKSGATQAESALVGDSASDVLALLDAMHDTLAFADRDAFAAARQANTWDAALSAAFGSGAATRLRDPAERWLNAGLAHFYTADTFVGELSALPGGALLSLVSVAQVPPASAGFPSSFQTAWSADSSDTLLLGTQLSWVPSRLVTALAVAPALLEVPRALAVDDALAKAVDCALVGKTLVMHGTVVGSTLYEGCDETCAVSSCASAVAALWKKASNASGSTSATLTVTASGPAQIGDEAEAESVGGSWVGELKIGSDTAPVSGALAGATPKG